MADLESRIKSLFVRDQTSGRIARTIDDIPVDYDHISNEWLTAVLCSSVVGSEVVDHWLDAPDEGTNNRRRIFISYNAAGVAAGLPRSVFCKATHGLRNRLMLGHSGAIRCEVSFYTIARQHLDIEAPVAFYARYDPQSFNSMVVLDDMLGRAEFYDHDSAVDRTMVEEQADLLANLHGRFYESPALYDIFEGLPTWHERFSGLASFRIEESCRAGFIAAESVIPPRLFGRLDEVWSVTMTSLDRQDALPKCLCHGDVHLKNWYRTVDGRIGLGDWGVTHKGHWSRDLVYMIATALTVDNRRAWENDLLRLYLDRLSAQGVPFISREEAFLAYRQALMTALAFWTMTLAPAKDLPDMQPPETALTFIGRLATAVDDLDSLDAF